MNLNRKTNQELIDRKKQRLKITPNQQENLVDFLMLTIPPYWEIWKIQIVTQWVPHTLSKRQNCMPLIGRHRKVFSVPDYNMWWEMGILWYPSLWKKMGRPIKNYQVSSQHAKFMGRKYCWIFGGTRKVYSAKDLLEPE